MVSLSTSTVVCRAPVKNVSVEVESASSVTVSWIPPDPQLWNGIISNYTVVYELIKSVDAEGDVEPLRSQSLTLPALAFSNSPDPRIATLPLKRESVVVESLEEFYVYQFTVILENVVGQSDISDSATVSMPPAGNVN